LRHRRRRRCSARATGTRPERAGKEDTDVIVRILGDGQYRLDDGEATELDARDNILDGDLARHDPLRFRDDVRELIAWVRSVGDRVGEDEFLPSDAVLPGEDMSLEEVIALLEEPTPEAEALRG
jgi:hypothetical protein